MATLLGRNVSTAQQYAISTGAVLLVSVICYALTPYMGYRVTALMLLLTVSLAAICFDILPVLFTATLSAFIWDFLFLPPRFAIHVDTTEDAILLLMYFVIALISAVLTHKIRKIEKASRQKEERANAIKLYDAFLNSLSHELRTPIAAIIGATDNLQEGSHSLSEGHRDELVGEISKAALRLNEQVENLLSMSRLESGFIRPRLDWCDVNELMHTVVQHAEGACPQHRVHIDVETDLPLFRLDKVMLEQIIHNLVTNACTHTPAGAVISATAENRAGNLLFVLSDDGPGFPEDEMPLVFDKFYRLRRETGAGTGLGLSIVKGFTEALGGTVTLQNLPDGGSRFTVNIPAETAYIREEA